MSEDQKQQEQEKDQLNCKNFLQMAEILSPFNMAETAKALGIPIEQVTPIQLSQHYTNSPRIAEMREANSDLNYWLTGCRLHFDPRTLPPGQLEKELWDTFLTQHPGLVPAFIPPCLRDKIQIPPCYVNHGKSVCMQDDHPSCPFIKNE